MTDCEAVPESRDSHSVGKLIACQASKDPICAPLNLRLAVPALLFCNAVYSDLKCWYMSQYARPEIRLLILQGKDAIWIAPLLIVS